MAKSNYTQKHYTSRDSVDSAGAILFDFRHAGVTVRQLLEWDPRRNNEHSKLQLQSEPTIALVYSGVRDEILLPKGRRNINESRKDAAIRETYEETGLRCQLLPVTLYSRATSVDPSHDSKNEAGYTTNEVRCFHQATDAFWWTVRHKEGDEDTKIISWYIAVVDEEQDEYAIELDPGCELSNVPLSKAVESLSYEDDRKLTREAIRIVQETFGI